MTLILQQLKILYAVGVVAHCDPRRKLACRLRQRFYLWLRSPPALFPASKSGSDFFADLGIINSQICLVNGVATCLHKRFKFASYRFLGVFFTYFLLKIATRGDTAVYSRLFSSARNIFLIHKRVAGRIGFRFSLLPFFFLYCDADFT